MHQGCIRSRSQAREEERGVVLDVAKLTAGREDYYLSRLADNREEYLSGHGESPGHWYGRAAATLGLDGDQAVAETAGGVEAPWWEHSGWR